MKPLTDKELQPFAFEEMRRQGQEVHSESGAIIWSDEAEAMFACFRAGYWRGKIGAYVDGRVDFIKHDAAIVPLSAQFWHGAAKSAKDQNEAALCLGEAWNHLINHLYALSTASRIGWAPGLPRLENNCRREFTVKLSTGRTRALWWLENYILDSHGDESLHTGWHTCREKEGYRHFFEPYKGAPVQYFQVDLAPTT